MNRKNPCYDNRTKTDCPNRCAECSTGCEKWKQYVLERDNSYKKRQEDLITEAYEITRARRITKLKKLNAKKNRSM